MSCGYVSPHVNRVGKVITFYVNNFPLDGDDLAAYQELLKALPPNPDCGIVLKQWRDAYSATPWFGYMVGLRDMTVPQSVEVLVQYKDFDMRMVPWDKLNKSKCA